MMDIEEFAEIKARIDKRKSELERKKGELESLVKSLSEEFDCATLEEAENLLAKMKEQVATLQERVDAKAESLKNAWESYCKAREAVNG